MWASPDGIARKPLHCLGQFMDRLEADMLLILGGAGVGEHDFTRGLLEQFDFTVHVSKAATQPGKPLIVGRRGR